MNNKQENRRRDAGFVVRRANANDVQAIGRVHVETWRSTYAGLVPDSYLTSLSPSNKAADWLRSIENPAELGATIVAATTGGIVGFANHGRTRNPELPFTGEVYALYVEIDWQNRGVGRALLARCFEDLRELGHRSALVWVLANNPARFFYEAMGGKPIAERQTPFAGTSLAERAYSWPDINVF